MQPTVKQSVRCVLWRYQAVALTTFFFLTPLSAQAHQDTWEQIEHITVELYEQPENAQLLLKRGRLFMEHEDYAPAIADFSRALEVAPDNLDALIYRGKAHHMAGDNKRALQDLNDYVSRGSADFLAFEVRADVREALGDREGAVADLRQAIQLRPKPEHFSKRAQLLKQLGREREAITSYEDGIQQLGAPVPLVMDLVALEAKSGRVDDALRRIEQLEAQAPRHERWTLRRAVLLKSAGRDMEAESAYRDALQQIETRLDSGKVTKLVLIQKVQALAGLGRYDEARQVLQSVDESVHGLEEYQELAKMLRAQP